MNKKKSIKPEARYLSEIKSLLYDKKWAKEAKDFPIYFIYRKVKEKNGLRYDITSIPYKMLGKEYVKTKGHEHLNGEMEIYTILKGGAIFLLQKREGEEIKDVFFIKAKRGDVVLIPPFYGHVTINPFKKELKMANWISKECKNDYRVFEKFKGACYYYTIDGWVKNKNYKKVPLIYSQKPIKKMPKDLSFLKINWRAWRN